MEAATYNSGVIEEQTDYGNQVRKAGGFKQKRRVQHVGLMNSLLTTD